MIDPTNFMIQQELRKYQSSLASWVNQVRGARSARDAFQVAGRKPGPSGILSSMKSLYATDQTRAKLQTEEILNNHISNMSDEDLLAQKAFLLQITAGNWIRLRQTIDIRLRHLRD
jgi:hypothetical protein